MPELPYSKSSSSPASAPCPLCGGIESKPHHSDPDRDFFLCPACTLVFAEPASHPNAAEERNRYEQHNNDGRDPRYLHFLRRLGDPLSTRLTQGARGLDFGSGPGPVLAQWLSSRGFPTASYDPFFFPDESLLAKRYDFISCSEVVEHLHAPGETFARLAGMLNPGGILGVMTRFYGYDGPFGEWWYRRDPTHVCFYREETMRWIAGRHGWRLELPAANVALFRSGDRA